MGRLIVIEGVDSSGKETQAKLLYEALKKKGSQVRLVSFPDYESDFCLPVKRYLAGDLGENPGDVNAYAASAFYAIDRYASFKMKWGAFYEEGGTIVCDRYVTSNIVHQAMKIDGDKTEFIDWLCDFEYGRLGLPVPDAVIFLDMPPEYAKMLMANRKNKITGEAQKDIHEKNETYLKAAYENALHVCGHLGWNRVCCAENGKIKEITEIHSEIVSFLEKKLK
ncbi:MAG TPA: thymidylate kinase [Clostridiales bacterium]|nr:thymidylate kinase [Clostridiales bacterium]HBL83067.1 thymidylate kinase [Clostridiales bacterium]